MTFTTRRIREERSLGNEDHPLRISPFVRAAGFFRGWYARWKAREQAEEKAQQRQRILKKTMVIVFSVFVGVLLLAGTVKALIQLQILTPHQFFAVAGKSLPTDDDGFTNILLLGGGDKSHEGVDLLDSIMVASIDAKKTKSVVMISLPRDLYIRNTEKMGGGRINSLYRDYKWYLRRNDKLPEAQASRLALEELSKEVSKIVGLPIHRVVKIDFIAFVQVVDALGGVDLEVPYDIVDTQYPGLNHSYETFEIRAGLQHLDGETALKYARSRHSTSDFDRSARQQQLLKALGEKGKAEGIVTSPGKITSLLKIMSEHVETTLSYQEMLGAGNLAEDLDRQNILSAQLHTQDGYVNGLAEPGGFLYFPPREEYNGASVLRPVVFDAEPEWSQIQSFVHFLTHSRAVLLSNPNLVILNTGAANGLARTLGNELTRNAFVVSEIDNASTDRKSELRNQPTSLIVPRTVEDQALAEFYGGLLQMPVGVPPPGIDPELLGQVTILLGKNYTFEPLRTLNPLQPSSTSSTDGQSFTPLTHSSSSVALP